MNLIGCRTSANSCTIPKKLLEVTLPDLTVSTDYSLESGGQHLVFFSLSRAWTTQYFPKNGRKSLCDLCVEPVNVNTASQDFEIKWQSHLKPPRDGYAVWRLLYKVSCARAKMCGPRQCFRTTFSTNELKPPVCLFFLNTTFGADTACGFYFCIFHIRSTCLMEWRHLGRPPPDLRPQVSYSNTACQPRVPKFVLWHFGHSHHLPHGPLYVHVHFVQAKRTSEVLHHYLRWSTSLCYLGREQFPPSSSKSGDPHHMQGWAGAGDLLTKTHHNNCRFQELHVHKQRPTDTMLFYSLLLCDILRFFFFLAEMLRCASWTSNDSIKTF